MMIMRGGPNMRGMNMEMMMGHPGMDREEMMMQEEMMMREEKMMRAM